MTEPAAKSPTPAEGTPAVESPPLAPEGAPICYVVDEEPSIRHFLSLVLHGAEDEIVSAEVPRYIASRIPSARFAELPGIGHLALGEQAMTVAAEIERFTLEVWEAGGWEEEPLDRVLATVLFTDIVDSTTRAAALGDRAWRELLERHHALIRRQLVRFRGAEIDVAGDGFFARFDGPARAIRCALAISDGVGDLGLAIRAGLHTGECEVADGKIAGIAVHTGARVAANALAGEVVVSSTVKDLVAGSGIEFEDRGAHQLEGMPGEWRLFEVASIP